MVMGGFRGGDAPPSGIRPPADPKGPLYDTFSEIHFWPTDPKIFLRAPSAPIYTKFEGELAPKKTLFFLSKFFKKCPKTAFLTVFQKFACGAENFTKIGAKKCFGRARKINLVDLKKRSSKFFENPPPPPPLKKILDPPPSMVMTMITIILFVTTIFFTQR